MDQLTPEQLAIIAKVEKLMALANNNDNEHQAEAAAAKAMELLAAYNLDMAMVGKTAKGKQGTARKDNKQKGGLYSWQRDLWKAVAELNFCRYWSIKGLERGSTYEHRILGSEVNVLASRLMAEYLQGAVERLTREYAKTAFPGQSIFIKELIAFREGMSHGLVQRLSALRKERIREDEQRKRENEARSKHPGAASNGTELVLMDVIDNENDLNEDYLYGYEPGTTSARRAEAKARQAVAAAAANAALEADRAWRLANPIGAAAKDAAAQAENDKWWADYNKKYGKRRASRASAEPRYRKATPQEERMMMPTFQTGVRKAEDVSLNHQVDETKKGRLA